MELLSIENRSVGVKLIFCNFIYIVFMSVTCVFSIVIIILNPLSYCNRRENTIRRDTVPDIRFFVINVYYHCHNTHYIY